MLGLFPIPLQWKGSLLDLDPLLIFCYFQAYDSHCNLVLGDVEETVYVVEDDDDDEDEEVKVGWCMDIYSEQS